MNYGAMRRRGHTVVSKGEPALHPKGVLRPEARNPDRHFGCRMELRWMQKSLHHLESGGILDGATSPPSIVRRKQMMRVASPNLATSVLRLHGLLVLLFIRVPSTPDDLHSCKFRCFGIGTAPGLLTLN